MKQNNAPIASTLKAKPLVDLKEATGASLDGRGHPRFDRETMQVGDTPLFIAGDANNDVPLLHEAADEGRVARLEEDQRGLVGLPLPQLAERAREVLEEALLAHIGDEIADGLWASIDGTRPLALRLHLGVERGFVGVGSGLVVLTHLGVHLGGHLVHAEFDHRHVRRGGLEHIVEFGA